jgi:hypothetical protein
MSNNIGSSNSNNNKNNNQIQTNYWIWFTAYIATGLAISFIVPFPISFGIALIVYFLLNMARTHIALKRQGVTGGIKELYKSMSSSLGGGSSSSNNTSGAGGIGYSPIKYYCMNCGYEHKKEACPKCGSKAVRVG